MIRLVIEAGDCVKLRSGGAVMTVEAVENGIARCAWLDKMSRLQHAAFSFSMLKQASGMAIDEPGIDYRANKLDIQTYRRSIGFRDA